MSWRGAIAFVVWIVSLEASASAQDRVQVQAALVYERGAGAERCPEASAIREAVATRLGYEALAADVASANVTVRVGIARRGRGLHATVDVFRAGESAPYGSRAIDSPSRSCDELATTIALTIAIALDPGGAMPAPVPAPPVVEPAPSPAPVESVPCPPAEPCPSCPPPAPARVEPAEPESGWEGVLAAGVVGSAGAAPSLNGGGAVSIAVRHEALSLAAFARIEAPSDADSSEGGGARMQLTLFGVAPCLHRALGSRFELLGCVVLGAGVLRGEGFDLARPEHESSFVAQVGGRIGIELGLDGTFGLRLSAELDVDLTRTNVTIDGATVWTSGPASGCGLLELVLHFS